MLQPIACYPPYFPQNTQAGLPHGRLSSPFVQSSGWSKQLGIGTILPGIVPHHRSSVGILLSPRFCSVISSISSSGSVGGECNRLTLIGALYVAFVCVLPEFVIAQSGNIPASVAMLIGGMSLLIIVSVTIDTVAQIQSHLIAHQYEGLIAKSKMRRRRR